MKKSTAAAIARRAFTAQNTARADIPTKYAAHAYTAAAPASVHIPRPLPAAYYVLSHTARAAAINRDIATARAAAYTLQRCTAYRPRPRLYSAAPAVYPKITPHDFTHKITAGYPAPLARQEKNAYAARARLAFIQALKMPLYPIFTSAAEKIHVKHIIAPAPTYKPAAAVIINYPAARAIAPKAPAARVAYEDTPAPTLTAVQVAAARAARAALKYIAEKQGTAEWRGRYTAVQLYYKNGIFPDSAAGYDTQDIISAAAVGIVNAAANNGIINNPAALNDFCTGILPTGDNVQRTYTRRASKELVTITGARAVVSYGIIAANAYINKQRTRAAALAPVDSISTDLQESIFSKPDSDLQRAEFFDSIAAAVGGKKSRAYEAVVLTAQGYTQKEIAAALKVSQNTICTTLKYARAALRAAGISPATPAAAHTKK